MNFDILNKLCYLYGVSGNEETVRDFIISGIKNFVDDLKIDNLGNLIVFKKGKRHREKPVVICTNMDEVGFIVTGITEDGYLTFENVGEIDTKILHGINVIIGKNNIPGVIGISPIHLTKSSDKSKPLKASQLFIDIGANSREEAIKNVNIGDYACYVANVFDTSFNGIRAKSLDNRAGCNILMELIKQELRFDTYFAFTVQDKVGLNGLLTTLYSVNPKLAFIINCTETHDSPDVPLTKRICNFGKGPAISFIDRYTIYNKKYYNFVLNIAKENNIPIQVKKDNFIESDFNTISSVRDGINTIKLFLPCRYLSCPINMINQNDYRDLYKLSYILINNFQ